MDMMRRVMLAQAAGGGGGGGGCGVVLATPYDDNFDCGSAIDTTGARFTGANAWTKNAGPFVSESLVGGEWKVTTTSRGGGGWDPAVAYQTLPSGDWTFETYCHQQANRSIYEGIGLYLEESSTGKAVVLTAGYNGGDIIGVGNSGGYYSTTPIGSWTTQYIAYLRVSRVGANLSYVYSLNGTSWTTVLTHAQTVPFTTQPNRVGVVKQNAIATGLTYNDGYFAYFYRTA